jgi:hypothetical protein
MEELLAGGKYGPPASAELSKKTLATIQNAG